MNMSFDPTRQVLAVIPAKLGSTRLKKKNIRKLGGKELLGYTIEAARESGVCDEVMVSTESPEVAAIAEKYGAHVPFPRPEHLGSDPYGVVDVCLHVLKEYEMRGRTFATMLILLPTSPFRTAEDIRSAYRQFKEQGAAFLMSVSETADNPYGALRFSDSSNNVLTPCFPDQVSKKRHELPDTYRCNGAVTVVDTAAFKSAGTYYGKPLHAYVMPWDRGLDIDTEADWEFARYLVAKGAQGTGAG